MKTGFIGAGKVGTCLGNYFKPVMDLAGYFSKSRASAKEAASITDTVAFQSMEELLRVCDTVFITVPDDSIAHVWFQIKDILKDREKNYNIRNICHTSGSLSASVFSDREYYHIKGYSIHPMYPFSNKTEYKGLDKTVFTIEGDIDKGCSEVEETINLLPNKIVNITGEVKSKYHLASVMASNAVVGLMNISRELLVQCGFDEGDALNALEPLVRANIDSIFEKGTVEALTGPVARGDFDTVNRHLKEIDGYRKKLYESVNCELEKIVSMKKKD